MLAFGVKPAWLPLLASTRRRKLRVGLVPATPALNQDTVRPHRGVRRSFSPPTASGSSSSATNATCFKRSTATPITEAARPLHHRGRDGRRARRGTRRTATPARGSTAPTITSRRTGTSGSRSAGSAAGSPTGEGGSGERGEPSSEGSDRCPISPEGILVR